MAVSSTTLFIVLSWLYPVVLLTTALTRLILPSFFYLFSFFYFILFPPLHPTLSPIPPSLNSAASSPTHSHPPSTSPHPSPVTSSSSPPPSHSHALLCHYAFRPPYFLLHVLVPLLFLVSHLLAIVLFHFAVLTPSPVLSFLGLSPVSTLASSALLVLPDFLFLAFSSAAFVLLQRLRPASFSVDVEARATAWNVASFFLLLFAGILYISLVALPYFLLFTAVVLHLSFQSYRYRHGHITSMPLQAQSALLTSSSFHLTALSGTITAFLPGHAVGLLRLFSWYVPAQMTLLWAYQYLSLVGEEWLPSRQVVNMLGLYSPTDEIASVVGFMPKWTAYVSTAVQLGLLIACGERRDRDRIRTQRRKRRRRQHEHDEEEQEAEEEEADEKDEADDAQSTAPLQADGAAVSEQKEGGRRPQYGSILGDLTVRLMADDIRSPSHAPPATPNPPPHTANGASSPPPSSPRPPVLSSPVTHSRSIAVRHFLLRLSRYSGRFFCSLLLGLTIFTLPSLLTILLLILLVASLLTSSSLFTRLAPYYLFVLLITALILYLFSIPLLFSGVPDWIGISHTHLPFVYVLDFIAPVLAFSAYLVTYRLSLASLTEESILIAVSSGDEDMVKAAMRQSPPVLITHAKDERLRSLLHLAARYGQLSLVLPLCRYLDVNAADIDGKTPLHYAYYHGYDRIVKMLLFHPLIDADRRDRFGQRALEQERSAGVRLMVAVRELWERASDLFLGNADLLSLLLLYFVSTANLDGLHLVYLAFFVVFFTWPSLAQKCWAVLVVYCAFILVLLFSFSVLQVNLQQGGDEDVVAPWMPYLALIGVFGAQSYIVDLALYYTVFVVVLVQWYVFERKEGRKREKGLTRRPHTDCLAAHALRQHREEREKERERLSGGSLPRTGSFPATSAFHSAPTTPNSSFAFRSSSSSFARSTTGDGEGEPLHSAFLPVYRASAIGLATVTLVTVALSSSSSLFYLAYLALFTLSLLALALGGRHYCRLLLAFYALSSLCAFALVVLEYAYLCHALSGFAPLYRRLNEQFHLTADVIGFRARDGVTVTWTMLPLMAVYVTQIIQLRAQLMEVRFYLADRRQQEQDDAAQDDPFAQDDGQLFQTPRRSDFVPLPEPSFTGSFPPSSVGIVIDGGGSGRASSATTPRSAPSSVSATPAPRQHRRRRRWSLAIEEAVSQHENGGEASSVLMVLAFAYSSLFSLLDYHAHHVLALLIILVVSCVDVVSVASLVYVVLLLLLGPFHQSYFLFIPALVYTPLLLLSRYVYQLPPVLSALSSHAELLSWLGWMDYGAALGRGLYGDVLVLFVAAVQQMVGMERRRMLTEKVLCDAEGAAPSHDVDRVEDRVAPLEFATQKGQPPQLLQHPGRTTADLIDARQQARTDEEEKGEVKRTSAAPSLASKNEEAASALPAQAGLAHSSSSPPSLPSAPSPSWTWSDWRMFLSSLALNLCARFSRFASTFLARYCLQLALLFILLTAAYRNNLLSVAYLIPIALYIVRGRALLHSIWSLLLVVVASTVLWQYLVLLNLPPSMAVVLPEPDQSRGMQRWLLLGSFSVSALSFDLFTYFFLCLELAYVGRRDGEEAEARVKEEDRRTRWRKLGRGAEAEESSAHLVIRSEEDYREWQEREEAREAARQSSTEQEEPSTPLASSASVSHLPSSSLSQHRVMDRRAALVWPTVTFYLVLTMDKLFFLFIFAAATSHLDLLSLPYLFASLYLLFSNKLYTGDRSGLTRFYSYLHWYNFFVLATYIAYQVPVLCPTPSEGVRWEEVVGLRKFVCDCAEGQCVAALSVDGALSPLLIFFLLDLQMLVLLSPLYGRIEAYYASARSLSLLRSKASTLHTQEQNKQRIVNILALRDQITRSFTSVFLLAAQLNAKYFEDTTVWSNEKPEGWDEAVERDLREQKKQDAAAREGEKEREEIDSTASLEDQDDPSSPDGSRAEEDRAKQETEEEADRLMKASATRQSRHDQRDGEGTLHYWRRLARWWLIHRIDMTLYNKYSLAADGSVVPLTHVDPRHLSTLTLLQRFIVTQSQYVVFFAYAVTLLLHPSLVSAVVPLFTFCYAVFEFPRAPSAFFVASFWYSLVLISAQFVFQLPLFCVGLEDRTYALTSSGQCTTDADDPVRYQTDYLIGITKASEPFFLFVLPELLCLLAIVWHREVSLERGVWGRKEKDEDTVHPEVLGLLERYEAAHQNPLSHYGTPIPSTPAIPQPNSHASHRIHAFLLSMKLRVLYALSFLPRSVQSYYARLVPAQRLHGIYISKPGSDFFLVLFFIELVCAALILFAWNDMAATTSTTVSSFTTNLFSAQMVAVLFVQTLIIVAERMIYTFRSIMAKIVLQYLTAALWLSLTLLVWPQWSETGVVDNPALQAFLVLKLLYLFFSGLQIFHGFPPVETTGMQDLTRHPGKYTVQLFKLYRAIPFVFELRTILDWMCTMSSLDLDETFKLEDIYTRLYLVQCALIVRREHRRGDSRPWDEKLLNGVLLFSLLLLIIFAPLLVFSSANPVTQSNPVTASSIELTLSGPRGQWTLFSISSWNATVSGLSDELSFYAAMRDQRLIDSNDKPDDVQLIQMTNFSDGLWTISPPALRTLTAELFSPTNDSFSALLEYTFTRPLPATTPTIAFTARVDLTSDERVEMGEFIETTSGRSSITLRLLAPTFWRLPASAAPIEINDATNRSALTLSVVNDDATGSRYFQAWVPVEAVGGPTLPLCNPALTVNVTDPPGCNVAFVVISNRVFGGVFSSFSFSIVSLYSLILFTFGQFIRLLFSNLVARIPYDDIQNADRLLALVESIYVARWKQEMRMEEILYRRLIKIMRTAPLLIELTKRDTEEEEGRGSERRRRDAEDEKKEEEAERKRDDELERQSRAIEERRENTKAQSEEDERDEDNNDEEGEAVQEEAEAAMPEEEEDDEKNESVAHSGQPPATTLRRR